MPSNSTMNIKPPTAKQVERLRSTSGLSAEAFGQIVYVGAAAVYAWEKGRRHCPLSAWEMLLIYFGKAEPRSAAPWATGHRMNDFSKCEIEAVAAVHNAQRILVIADKLCAKAGMDGDEVVQPIDEARRLLDHVAKVIQG